MFAIAKAVLIALAVTGIAATGAVAGMTHAPMQNAIDIHKDHMGQNSTMPIESRKGQQTALDHLMENRERWLAKPHNETGDDDLNDTDDDDQNETDDEEEVNEIDATVFNRASARMNHWMKIGF